MQEQQQSQITARPNVYIEVTIGDRKQVYDLLTAETLRKELTLALNQLQNVSEVLEADRTDQNPLRDRPYDQAQQSDDESRLAVDGVRNRGA